VLGFINARAVRRASAAAVFSAATVLGAGAARAGDASSAAPLPPESTAATDSPSIVDRLALDTLTGLSGKLRARFVVPRAEAGLPVLSAIFGDSSVLRPGVYPIDSALIGKPFAFITLRPFADKKNGRIGSYRMGSWPFERRAAARERYKNPLGFIEVTPENQDTYVSEHFRLRDGELGGASR